VTTSRLRTVQLVLFTVGAILMPLGLVAILIGWYGTAHAKYAYDQTTYLVSGGLLGIGLIMLGGFLYFGSWLVRMTADQRAAAQQLADTLQTLTAILAQPSPASDTVDGSAPVLAGDGRTVHRRDCPLIAHRTDLHEPAPGAADLVPCRVCRPLRP
jgi:hypothetical protein